MRGVGIAVALAVLAGCATAPLPPPSRAPEQAWRQREAALQSLDTWTLSGRLVISSENEAWNANLYWSQRADGYEVSVIAPLGGGSLQLRGSSEGVVLRTSDDALYLAQDPEALIQEVLGLQIPVSGLRYWVLGIPKPGLAQQHRLDPWGRLEELQQERWQVEFLRYRETPNGHLPDKLYMRNEHFEVRLVISDWEFPTAGVPIQTARQ